MLIDFNKKNSKIFNNSANGYKINETITIRKPNIITVPIIGAINIFDNKKYIEIVLKFINIMGETNNCADTQTNAVLMKKFLI